MAKPIVGIVMGSDSDLPIMEEAARTLETFGIPYEITIASAHRSPRRAGEYARTAADRGLAVIIAGAGWAAHLAGVLAAETTLPVIGVPIPSSPLAGVDALYATVMMPAGVPVAAMALGKGGARNAAVLAAQILTLRDPALREKLVAFKKDLAEGVERKAEALAASLDGTSREKVDGGA